MRLLAEVFLPRTQNQLRESISKERNSPKLKEQNSSLLGGTRDFIGIVFLSKILYPIMDHVGNQPEVYGFDRGNALIRKHQYF